MVRIFLSGMPSRLQPSASSVFGSKENKIISQASFPGSTPAVGVESGALCEKSATHDDFSKLESLSENC